MRRTSGQTSWNSQPTFGSSRLHRRFANIFTRAGGCHASGSKCALLCLSYHRSSAQQPPAAQPSPPARKAPPSPAALPATDQEQFLSYWTTETGWRTELQLRNNQPAQDISITPVFRKTDGVEVPLTPVTVKAKEVRAIDLSTIIGSSTPQVLAAYGSLVLRYHSVSSSDMYAVATATPSRFILTA